MARQESLTRNSPLRILTGGAMTWCAAGLYNGIEKSMGIKIGPDVVTVMGLAGVWGVTRVTERLNRNRSETGKGHPRVRVGLGLLLLGFGILDGVDGAMDRYLNSVDPLRQSSSYGAFLDVAADRFQEAALALSRARSAYHSGDPRGEKLAYLAAATNPLPSIVRAFGEGFRGRVSTENGGNIFEFFGTRPGKVILGGLSTIIPRELKGLPVQEIIDGVQIQANALSTVGRARGIIYGTEVGLSAGEQRLSRQRFIVLLGVEAIILLSIKHTYRKLRQK